MRKCHSLFYCLLLFLSTTGIKAQESIQITASRIDSPIIVDGRLDDAGWELAIPFTEFLMVEPQAGLNPTERTEARIVFDQKNLYIAVRCYDASPRKISGNTMVHDELGDFHGPVEDMVSILLDPFQDKRNAYLFHVNPRGARSEGFASGEHSSLNWDGIWNARSMVDGNGWAVEIMIPFKTLSFNPSLQSWGINIERFIARKQERIRMSGIRLDSFFTNPNEAASLNGISGMKMGSGTTVRPYAVGSLYRDRTGETSSSNIADAGIDVYQNITPFLVGSLSYNTDFAETEVDEKRVNLTRFPLYYPEKRTFFLEGSDIFDFGPSGTSRGFMPFFSRRIGLDDDNIVPVILGAKMYGKIGKTNISFLDVQTGKTDGLSSTNMFAGRISQNILKESKAGLIFTNGSQSGEPNSLAGADLVYSTSRLFGNYNFVAGFWGVYNFNDAESGHKEAYGLKIDFPNDLVDAALVYNYYGDSINPGLGFLPRTGVKNLLARASFNPRPGSGFAGRMVRQFSFDLMPSLYWNVNGGLESRVTRITFLGIRFESGDQVALKVNNNLENLPYDFQISEPVTIPMGNYAFTNFEIEAGSSTHRSIYGSVNYKTGGFYSGSYSEATFQAAFRYKGYVTLVGGATVVRGELPEGDLTENLFNLKINLFLNPDLGITNYFEFDDTTDRLFYNGRFFWQISPGNIIYLVYNTNHLRMWDPESRFAIQQEKLSVKVQLTIR